MEPQVRISRRSVPQASKVRVMDITGDCLGTDKGDGQLLLDRILSAMKESNKVVVSFAGIAYVNYVFLSTALGGIYSHYLREEIEERIIFADIYEDGRRKIEKVLWLVGLFYEDEDEYMLHRNELID
jgi:hypothetical protein